MDMLKILYQIVIGPLQLLFEFVFSRSYKLIGNPGICIVILSVVMNILALPLYRRADMMQKQAADKMKAVQPWQDRIRKTFKGDERFMMLQAYNREKGVKPSDALKGSVSLLLEIPFFIAAFRMLSSLQILNGKSFGPISDLGSPDGLIAIGAVSINLLPILMTVINLVSSSIYLKDSDMKGKIQLYGIAAIFLVLLYNSPAGLVFYWTCNNIFSLVKNIIMVNMKTPVKKKKASPEEKGETVTFITYALALSIFVGLMIPADFLRRSVGDFISFTDPSNPGRFLVNSFALALGTFMVWMGVIFFLSSSRKIANMVIISLSLIFILDYYAFYRNYGNLNKFLVIAFGDFYILKEDVLMNLAVIAMAAILVFILYKNRPVIFRIAVIPFLMAGIIVSVSAVISINSTFRTYDYLNSENGTPEITLSREGKNVIVIMLDRAQGFMFRYIMEEKPELLSTYDGFTYYPNTVSFGRVTNIGAPPLFGGYDYTPDRMNERSDESLMDKHNESLLVMPVLFSERDYDVVVCDAPYANYKMITDMSIYDGYDGISAYRTEGFFNDREADIDASLEDTLERNLFCYSMYLVSPMFMRSPVYDRGYYNDLNAEYTSENFFQVPTSVSEARGISADFLDSYSVLEALPGLTSVTDDETGSFFMMDNNTAHSPMILSEPDYVPAADVDNTLYDSQNRDRFTYGVSCEVSNPDTMAHYHANVAAIMALGEWFDYMREQGVYDNTRIIIVADHGAELHCLENGTGDNFNAIKMNPLLLYKDFDATGFTICDDLMTNAEVPYLATDDLLEDAVNPFTGNPFISMRNCPEDMIFFNSNDYDVEINNGNTFMAGDWYRLTGDDILDLGSWEYQGTW